MDKTVALAATKEKEKEKEKQKFLAKEREKRLAREASQLRSLTLRDITIKGTHRGKYLTFIRAGYTLDMHAIQDALHHLYHFLSLFQPPWGFVGKPHPYLVGFTTLCGSGETPSMPSSSRRFFIYLLIYSSL